MKIYDLRCEYEANPLGIDVLEPRLSWKLQDERRGARQSAYRVLVASSEELLSRDEADLWDSSEVQSDRAIWVQYEGQLLSPRLRAFWKVQAWDEQGNASQYSNVTWFETGLMGKPLGGEWIGSPLAGGVRNGAPAPYLRKTFQLEGSIKSARLYATALGLYEYSINGTRVGDDVFTPGWTDYHTRVQLHTYDVTELLQSGDNVCGAILGDGWYCGHVDWRNRQSYGDRPKLRSQLVVNFDDGRTQAIETDTSWKYSFGAIMQNDLIMGEHYDARREIEGWNTAQFDDSQWNVVETFEERDIEICAPFGPPVRRQEELKPIEIKTIYKWPSNDYVFDMGQNMVGRVRLKLKGEAGLTLRLRHAEVLNPNGTLYTENLRTALQTDYYTFKSDEVEEWEPRFTFHGFRYVEIRGLKEEPALDVVTGVVLHSDIQRTGEWSSDNALLNQLQHNIWWGQKGNFLEVPTDCPQRDERMGWTGDAQVFVRTAAFNADVSGFFAKWQRDILDAQGKNGAVPSTVPNPCFDPDNQEISDGGPAWSDATVICPWTNYLVYGDKRVLEDNYDVFVRYLQHLDDISRPHGLIRSHPKYQGFRGFGDWLSTDTQDFFGTTREDLIGTAFFAYSSKLLSKIARVLGKAEDVAKYEKLAEEVKAAFIARFVTSAGLLAGGTQTSYVLALHFDLLPENLRATAVDELVADIKKRRTHISTGFVGSPYIAQVLSDNGRLDVAYELLHQTEYPSWLYAVTQGATTIWERWDGWTHDKGFQDASMNSFNHYAYGAIGAWMYSRVAGIEIDENEAAYKHIIFKPYLDPAKTLSQARAVLKSAHGDIQSDWKIEGEQLTWNILVPTNTCATVFVPASDANRVLEGGNKALEVEGIEVVSAHNGYVQFKIGSGSYQFSAPVTFA